MLRYKLCWQCTYWNFRNERRGEPAHASTFRFVSFADIENYAYNVFSMINITRAGKRTRRWRFSRSEKKKKKQKCAATATALLVNRNIWLKHRSVCASTAAAVLAIFLFSSLRANLKSTPRKQVFSQLTRRAVAVNNRSSMWVQDFWPSFLPVLTTNST